MRRILLGVLCLVAFTSAASADNIFDTITGGSTGLTTTGSTPRSRMGDGFTVANQVDGLKWSVETAQLGLFVSGAGTYTNVTMQVIFWGAWNPSAASGSVFSNQLSNVTWNLGTVTSTGNQVFPYSLPYASNNLSFVMNSGQTGGIEVNILSGGVANTNLALTLRDQAPTAGSATNGFYRDANSNGILEASDARTFAGVSNANVYARLVASAIGPEPGSMALLLVGTGGLLVRRRRKA